jgi:DNA-binding NarL/FixJ family response regulator
MNIHTASPPASAVPIVAAPDRARIAATRPTSLCLVVHDELELRLRLAGLLRRASPKLDADTVTRAGFDAISVERLRAYIAVVLIIEFSPPEAAADPLSCLARLHGQLPELPIFVFARGGNERSAARAMKLGATDYWPIHSVIVAELASALQPIVEPPPSGNSMVSGEARDPWRQPEIAGYTLMKKIAQSSLAAVYLARNGEFNHPVALKIQAIDGLAPVTQAERARFTRECEILSRLNHRSIANVLDHGISEKHLYLALEYFPCGSLRDRMKHPINDIDALNYAQQIGEALQIVHAARVVHRDLKPSNLMLTDDNRLVLIDFGSARTQLTADDEQRPEDCTGTPYYMCPEQTADREPDARGDLYSLGVVLYEMLAGRVPYTGNGLTQILAAHRDEPIPRLPSHKQACQPLIDRLLAKMAQERFSDAGQFLAALDAVRNELNLRRSNHAHRSA